MGLSQAIWARRQEKVSAINSADVGCKSGTDPAASQMNNVAREKRLAAVLAAIDAVNAEDPEIVEVERKNVPGSLVHGRRMSETLAHMHPNPSECLRIAARGQHIERWKVPRKSYPAGREGYLSWRKHQRSLQAERLGGLMAEAGYSADEIDRVGVLIRKERLEIDPEAQLFEDVICVVFLKYHFKESMTRVEEDKLADILVKTWKRMSDYGRSYALKLDLSPALPRLLDRGQARLQVT